MNCVLKFGTDVINNISSYSIKPIQTKNQSQKSFGSKYVRPVITNPDFSFQLKSTVMPPSEAYSKVMGVLESLLIPKAKAQGINIPLPITTFNDLIHSTSIEHTLKIKPIFENHGLSLVEKDSGFGVYKCKDRIGKSHLLTLDPQGLSEVDLNIEIGSTKFRLGAYRNKIEIPSIHQSCYILYPTRSMLFNSMSATPVLEIGSFGDVSGMLKEGVRLESEPIAASGTPEAELEKKIKEGLQKIGDIIETMKISKKID